MVSINYRLNREAIIPAAVNDAKAFIKYLRANASPPTYITKDTVQVNGLTVCFILKDKDF